MMKDLDKWDLAGMILAMLAWLRGEKSHAAEGGAKDPKQKIVSVLHAFASKVDEGMWLSLITKLDKKQKGAITRLLESLDRFRERDSFRLTVVDAPVATITDEAPDPSDKTGQKKIRKVVKVGEYSDEDTRVIFLRAIADLVDDPEWGPEAVRNMLRTNELATENNVAKHALRFWDESLSWMNKRMCAFFGVNSLEEITLAKSIAALNAEKAAGYIDGIAEKIPDRCNADINQGFWRWAFRHHPILASILIAGAILMTAIFVVISK